MEDILNLVSEDELTVDRVSPAADPEKAFTETDIGGAVISDAMPDLKAKAYYTVEKNVNNRKIIRKHENLEEYHARMDAMLVAKGEIQSAIRHRTLMRGVISMVTEKSVGGMKMACLIIPLENRIQVIIPYSEIFQNDPIRPERVHLDTEEGRRDYFERQELIARKLIGLETRFVPTALLEGGEDEITYVLASRKQYLEIFRRHSYLSENPSVRPNAIYNGTVTNVGKHTLRVMVGGIEKDIPYRVATNRPIINLEDVYAVGDILPVYIRSVDIKNGDADAEFDLITAEIESSRPNLNQYQPGASVMATISKVLAAGEAQDNCRLYGWVNGGAGAPLKLTNVPITRTGRPIKVFDTVLVRISGVNVGGDGYVRGYVDRVVKASPFSIN